MIITSLENEKIKEYFKLKDKKTRDKTELFLVEGRHLVLEAYRNNLLKELLIENEEVMILDVETTYVTSEIINKLSDVETPQKMIGVCYKPTPKEDLGNKILILDGVQDPGNLGTIIRSAMAFNIDSIILGENTVDLYNPKVIAAAKGSFLRVQMFYQELLPVLEQSKMPVYGAYLEGESVHQLKLSKAGGYLVMGNEANGISPALKPVISHPVTIPSFSDTESLNVGIATAILCDNFKRLSAS